jgi:hypothetical protein
MTVPQLTAQDSVKRNHLGQVFWVSDFMNQSIVAVMSRCLCATEVPAEKTMGDDDDDVE